MNDPNRWNTVKLLLDRALDLPPDQRVSFLEAECGDDAELLDEVTRLLAAAEPQWDILEGPAMNMVPSPDPDIAVLEGLEGSVIDSYRLLRLRGVGGMGVVYEAERTGSLTGRVAVKLIKRGMASAVVARRFRHEREILARLTHPNIAHFIDGGVTEDEQPYFVMELVDGEPITTYSERHDLSLFARVRLFLQVLEAVGFAHSHLVVHRDVKPSNVLVSPGGRVKLLDFGVAKVLGDEDHPDATITRVGGRVLTPSYSSPEQIRGEPVTTAADVYSLGVLLYEVLVGQKPFDLDTEPLAEIQRVVSFDEPTRPSDAVTTGARDGTAGKQTYTRRLSSQLSGDVDAIVLKALRKDPDRRYSSAQEFHDDLCRYLDGQPVLARRGTLAYRTTKFVSKHRLAAAVLAALVLPTFVGAGLVLQERDEAATQRARAEQRVADVRDLVNTLLFDVHDAVADLPGSTEARALILETARERLADVEADLPNDPDLMIQLADGFRRIGDVQGRGSGQSLGRESDALATFRRALPLAQRAVALAPENMEYLRTLGLVHERLATAMSETGDIEGGVAESKLALDIYEHIATVFPDSVRHQITAVIGWINLSDLQGHPGYPNLGLIEDATLGYQEAGVRLNREPLLSASSSQVLRMKGLVPERLGRMLRLAGRWEEAGDAYQTSLQVRQALFDAGGGDDDVWRDIPVTHQNLCAVERRLGNMTAAADFCGRALAEFEARYQSDSVSARSIFDMALIHHSLEELTLSQGDTLRALGHIQQRVEWANRRLEREEVHLPTRQHKLDALITRALIQAKRGVPVTARGETQSLAEALDTEGHLTEAAAAQLDSIDILTGTRR